MGNRFSADSFMHQHNCSARNLTWQYLKYGDLPDGTTISPVTSSPSIRAPSSPMNYTACPYANEILHHHGCWDHTCLPNRYDHEFKRYEWNDWDGLGSPWGEGRGNGWWKDVEEEEGLGGALTSFRNVLVGGRIYMPVLYGAWSTKCPLMANGTEMQSCVFEILGLAMRERQGNLMERGDDKVWSTEEATQLNVSMVSKSNLVKKDLPIALPNRRRSAVTLHETESPVAFRYDGRYRSHNTRHPRVQVSRKVCPVISASQSPDQARRDSVDGPVSPGLPSLSSRSQPSTTSSIDDLKSFNQISGFGCSRSSTNFRYSSTPTLSQTPFVRNEALPTSLSNNITTISALRAVLATERAKNARITLICFGVVTGIVGVIFLLCWACSKCHAWSRERGAGGAGKGAVREKTRPMKEVHISRVW